MSQNEILDDIRNLLKLQLRIQLRNVLEEELQDSTMNDLYELVGLVSIKEASQKVGYSTGKISGILQDWERKGMIIKDGKSYKKVIE